MSSCDYDFVPDVYATIAEPNRRRILALLRESERPAGEIVAALGLAQPAVSKHLKALKAAGLATSRVDGARRLYRLTPGPLAEVDAWLSDYRAFWTGRLNALDDHLQRSD